MPRHAREKGPECMYHIMVRSISDTPLLFKNDADKDKFLRLVKKYQEAYLFRVYGYCLMDNHAHLIIDAQGADISRIMHGINQSYAQYFNLKYNRRGHLFQDRFKSKIITDERYLIALSAYIHCNPKDVINFTNKIEKYKYSSLGMYLGSMRDRFAILNRGFILNMFSRNLSKAKKLYWEYICTHNTSEKVIEIAADMEFMDEKADYRSERRVIIRSFTPPEVVDFVKHYIKDYDSNIIVKYTRTNMESKSLSALLLRSVCDMTQKDICSFMGNISQSHAAKLCARGIELLRKKSEYKNIITDFVDRKIS
ncbi:transposase IS200 like protein [Oxobacter pfennigii]|uniref:Transposase IS200 like protein n=1 Tax=Oxobacter pfennigii TaxID=36849 RepID=A0A0P8W5D5_9CLOT|nr:transposase [Oxobacter pfennigii]KPU43842.1 transposase IS200 like protein [Oxobacter pfennigii]